MTFNQEETRILMELVKKIAAFLRARGAQDGYLTVVRWCTSKAFSLSFDKQEKIYRLKYQTKEAVNERL